ncbi:helix-turn-helix domain-containing protein [Sphingomonas sp.]|uniref:helix-turn-helix domain-containing protein n=1 Tax=Sphingomonas sp. TaxID=28214 RepID=UPI003D6D73BB
MDWDGETRLGDGWAAYEGPTADSRPHRHLAIQLAIGLKEPVAIAGDRGTVMAPAILVRAGARHRLLPAPGGVRCVFVEVDSRAGQAWQSATIDDDIFQAPADLAHEFRAGEDVAAAMRRLTDACPHRVFDDRLARVLTALAENPGGSGAIGRAALTAGVSVSCLRALAAEALAAPLAQWRQWRMLAKAAAIIATGQSLADAAAEAGFSDQAHLTRIMGRFFGITPRVAATSLRKAHGLRAV